MFTKKQIYIVFFFSYSILIGNDNLFRIRDYYHIEKEHTFSSKILNVKLADKTDEYIVVTEGSENNLLSYYSSDNSLVWEKEIGHRHFTEISENGNTVVTYRNQKLEVYNRDGNLLFTKNAFETGYFLSSNGKYLIDYQGDSPREFYYYDRMGNKIKPNLPERFDAPLYYLRFTPDNNILALFIGQKSDKSYTRKIKSRMGYKEKTYLPLEGIEIGSYIIKYNLENKHIEWIHEIKDVNVKSGIMNLNYFSMGKSFYVLKDKLLLLLDDVFDKSNILCFDYIDGTLLWEKEFDINLGFTANTFYHKDDSTLVVESKRQLIYQINISNQDTKVITEIPKSLGTGGMFQKMWVANNGYVLYDTWKNIHLSVKHVGKGEMEYELIEGALLRTKAGKAFIYNKNSLYEIDIHLSEVK